MRRVWTKWKSPLPDWRLIAVGRIGRGPEADLFNRYNDRLRPKLTVSELLEGRGAPAEIKRREGDAILATLPANAFAVALDLGARPIDSETFSALTTTWLERARPIAFLIGGAEGLDTTVMARADHTLSLGALTWPHMLVRVMLAEQLFRARAIASNHPYHRAGRP
jgi:23S rRNA (pseudouridine1915-N3)-methyltransferase